MKSIKKTSLIFGLLSLMALFAFAKQEKVLQIFRNGEIIQEYAVDDIDYIEVNERLAVPEQIPFDEIWYVTSDGNAYDHNSNNNYNNGQPFDCKVLSNEYYGDHGVIKFDGPVKRINDFTFQLNNFTAIYLPDCVEYIAHGAFAFSCIKTFRVPKNLSRVDGNPFYGSPNLSSFTGYHISDDGRCLIVDNCIHAFAQKGITSYTTPEGTKSIGMMAFFCCNELEAIEFNEGVEYIGADAFAESVNLRTVKLPGSLKELHTYAFRGCYSVEGFYGNERFHTSDNRCLVSQVDNPYLPTEWQGPWIINFAGKGLNEYTIPEGIVGMENYAFYSKIDLKSITLPNSLKQIAGRSFYNCPNIESIYGAHVSSDNKSVIFDGKLDAFVARKDIKNYRVPDETTKIGYNAFCESSLEEITMGDNITEIDGYAFSDNYNLRSLTLSASLKSFTGYNPIINDRNLETIYMRAPIPPAYSDIQLSEFPNLKIYVPEESYEMYMNAPQWVDYRQYFVAHHYNDLDIENYLPDYYYSTDYSQNGVVETIFSATEGNGIDIVLMGDGFSDRQIADGTYRSIMQNVAGTLFSEEPYKSFKDMFNVYMVNVVSLTEGYDNGATALGGYFGGGTLVGGNDAACFRYAQKAISDERMDEALIVVVMNQDAYAGTCWMYYPSGKTGDFGCGASIAYFPINSDTDTFDSLIRHEALGHGFAKLADEYSYDYMGEIPGEEISRTRIQQQDWGWYKNVDFTSDVSVISWNKFITDPRYESEGLGAYEGGLTYWSGVWRSTENSVMRYNYGGFNAPSREAIYYRIHKLAYGDNWTYNYEDFAIYDSINRDYETIRRLQMHKPNQSAPLHSPVIVGKNWREAKPVVSDEHTMGLR